jgi:hypothetical protein
MAELDGTVWLKPVAEGCGHCLPSAAGKVCVGDYGQPCARPRLEGDPALLQRVLDALRDVSDAEGNLVDGQRVAALRIAGGEAELTLAFPAGCGQARWLAEDAFQVLRRVLPDTDVYVLHAR